MSIYNLSGTKLLEQIKLNSSRSVDGENIPEDFKDREWWQSKLKVKARRAREILREGVAEKTFEKRCFKIYKDGATRYLSFYRCLAIDIKK